MEKRRVRLEINGVICGLITQESDEYMKSLADEVSEMLEEIQLASPYTVSYTHLGARPTSARSCSCWPWPLT